MHYLDLSLSLMISKNFEWKVAFDLVLIDFYKQNTIIYHLVLNNCLLLFLISLFTIETELI